MSEGGDACVDSWYNQSIMRWTIVIFFLAMMGIGVCYSGIGAAWPSMYGELGVSDSALGIVSMIMAGGIIVGGVFSGHLSGNLSTSKMIVLSAAVFVVTMGGTGFAGAFFILCLIVAPLGFFLGAGESVIDNHLAVHYPAKFMNWAHCCWSIGASIGPVILSFAIAGGAASGLAGDSASGLAAASGAASGLAGDSASGLAAGPTGDTASNVASSIASDLTSGMAGASGLAAAGSWRFGFLAIGGLLAAILLVLLFTQPLWRKTADAGTVIQKSEKVRLPEVFRLSGIWLSLGSFFCYVAFELTIGNWGASYMVMAKGVAPDLAARWISLFFVGMTAARFGSGFLSLRLSNHALIRLGCALVALGVFFMFLPFGAASYLPGFILMGAGCAPIFPGFLMDTPGFFGEKYSQTIVGLQVACANVGSIVTLPLFGAIASRIGYAFFPVFVAVFLVATIVCFETLVRRKAKELP